MLSKPAVRADTEFVTARAAWAAIRRAFDLAVAVVVLACAPVALMQETT